MAAVDDFAAQLAAAGITADKPLYAVLATVHSAALAAQAQPVADMERAARAALMGLRPAFEHRWRWQRWAALVGAFAAGCASMGLVAVGAWTLSAAVARHDAGAEVARWQSWWNATCADQSTRRVLVAGKPVCQVPMEQAAGR